MPPHSEFNYVSVLAASIPKSYYMIESGYNTFILQDNQSQVNITLQAGNSKIDSVSPDVVIVFTCPPVC